MKKILFIAMLLLSSLLHAQSSVPLKTEIKGIVNRAISIDLPEGSKIQLLGFTRTPEGDIALVKTDIRTEKVLIQHLSYISFQPSNVDEFWIAKAVENGVYADLLRNGYQFELREELNSDVQDYIKHLQDNDLFFQDSYLENYLNLLANEISPQRLDDGRPGIINVKVVKDPTPNAHIYSNGMLFINTGLFSVIHSENELLAVLANEIAHLVLDHSVLNINAALARQRRSEFWATMATGLVAASEIYTATRNPYYYPGDLTFATAILSSAFAESINSRLGVKYLKNQEIAADKCTVEFLDFINVSPSALTSVLAKTDEHIRNTGMFSSTNTNANYLYIKDRIAPGTQITNTESHDFTAKVSFVNTFNAVTCLSGGDYDLAQKNAIRNVNAGVAVEDDYMVLATINLSLNYSDESNRDALRLLETAKSLNIYPSIRVHKLAALTLFRLGRNQEAKSSLESYRKGIENQWDPGNSYLVNEYEWTVKMLAKIHLL